MATTTNSQAVLALDTAVAGTSLNALANAGYALGAAIDNRPTSGTTVSYDLADFTMTLSSAVTAGSGSPNVQIWILPAIDATNYASPNAASAAPTNLLVGTYGAVASASVTTIVVRDLSIPATLFKVLIQNNLGVVLPATNTSTCQIQRRTVQNW